MKNFRISPGWWPVFILFSPILLPWILGKYMKYKKNQKEIQKENRRKIAEARNLDLEESEKIKLQVIVDWKTKKGFRGDAAVSYLFTADDKNMLFDIGHGKDTKAFLNNFKKLKIKSENIDGLTISHLHRDHMGGMKSFQENTVVLPEELRSKKKITCFLPSEAKTKYCKKDTIKYEKVLLSKFATTGPLERAMFIFEKITEQALVMKLKNKGLVVFTGCGHPTIQVILDMVKAIFDEPIYAVGGGLHFPVKSGRIKLKGIDLQRIIGTGFPIWKKLTDRDLNRTIDYLNDINPKKVLLSAHDTDDYALEKFKQSLYSDVEILEAGEKYII